MTKTNLRTGANKEEDKKWNISKIQHIYRIQIDLKIYLKTPRCPVDLAAVRLAVAQFPKIQ